MSEIKSFVDQDLSHTNFQYKDLSNADFTGAILINTDFYKANLSKANLSGTNLRKANLSKANLTKADLLEANLIDVDLTLADLTEANLSGADLSRADLSEVDFDRANLTNAILVNTILIDATFTNANLSSAYLRDANLRGTDFYKTNLSGVDLTGLDLSKCKNYIPDTSAEKKENIKENIEKCTECRNILCVCNECAEYNNFCSKEDYCKFKNNGVACDIFESQKEKEPSTKKSDTCIVEIEKQEVKTINTTVTKIKKGKKIMKETIQKNIEAAKLASMLKASEIVLSNTKTMIKDQLPENAAKILDFPGADVVLSNAASVLLSMYKGKYSDVVSRISEKMLIISMYKVLDLINIDKLLTGINLKELSNNNHGN